MEADQRLQVQYGGGGRGGLASLRLGVMLITPPTTPSLRPCSRWHAAATATATAGHAYSMTRPPHLSPLHTLLQEALAQAGFEIHTRNALLLRWVR